MKLRLEKEPIIDNVTKHSSEMVAKLRNLLMAGAPAHPDPHRKNFYEVENCSQVYYIHVSPTTGKVMFLAVWDKDEQVSIPPTHVSERAFACC